jgi:hypothetical protein
MQANVLKRFQSHLVRIELTRTRMDSLHSQGQIVLRDLESVYEALFLRAVTSFEAFLEELFISILREKTTYSQSRVSLRMRAANSAALLEILLQGKDYMQWLPFNATEQRANLYLKGGRPFSELTNGDKSMMKTITTIRNAIAHRSDFAMRQFETKVIGNQSLLPRERTPAGYLRVAVSSQPPQTKFDSYMGELSRLSAALC